MMELKKKNRGIAAIFVAISMTVLFLFAALAIDIGILALNKNRVQNACDAAALAGAKELPTNKTEAERFARKCASVNGVSKVGVGFSDDLSTITVTADKPVGFFIYRIIDINKNGIASAKASAMNAPLTGVKGLVPFGVPYADYAPGTEDILLKKNSNSDPAPTQGNFQAVDLNGSSGSKTYLETIKTGSDLKHWVGEWIPTEPGDMAGPTKEGLEAIIGKEVIVPLIDPTTMDVNGKKCVQIKGFAAFLITESFGNNGNGNGQLEVKGTFIRMVSEGEIGTTQTDYGVRGVKLTE